MKQNQYDNFFNIAEQVIHCFYAQQIQNVFSYFHPDIMWIGTAEKQYKAGYKAVSEYLLKISPSKCRVLNKNLTILYSGKGNCLVTGNYIVQTAEGSREILEEEQRMTLFGIKVMDEWKILHIHISNTFSLQEPGEMFPHKVGKHTYNYMLRILRSKLKMNIQIILQDKKQTTHILYAGNILYIEAVGGYTEIHEKNKVICIPQTLAEIKRQLPDQFVQVHRSYLVNVVYVTEIYRYEVKIGEKCTVPLPQKKYSQIRENILKRLEGISDI